MALTLLHPTTLHRLSSCNAPDLSCHQNLIHAVPQVWRGLTSCTVSTYSSSLSFNAKTPWETSLSKIKHFCLLLYNPSFQKNASIGTRSIHQECNKHLLHECGSGISLKWKLLFRWMRKRANTNSFIRWIFIYLFPGCSQYT